ncbi:MAG: hypothetical protein II970_07425 [Paludibacteraceae bacterium]|nr:hypothetical protein [Paludibacteraceae bacterium]
MKIHFFCNHADYQPLEPFFSKNSTKQSKKQIEVPPKAAQSNPDNSPSPLKKLHKAIQKTTQARSKNATTQFRKQLKPAQNKSKRTSPFSSKSTHTPLLSYMSPEFGCHY